MKNIKTIFCLLGMLLFLAPSGFAEITDKGFESRHTYRLGIRSDEDDYDFYLTRAQGYLDYNFALIDRTIRIAPFFEYQSNLDTNTWWRKEVGAEFGTFFFNKFFYYGASFQHVWQKEENYSIELLDETSEWESRFVFTYPVQWGIFKDRLEIVCFDEYVYDFTRGQATVNEVGATLDWKVLDWLHLPVGWRHIDRVHDFDSDLLEFSVLFGF